jgi:hypothetical protein
MPDFSSTLNANAGRAVRPIILPPFPCHIPHHIPISDPSSPMYPWISSRLVFHILALAIEEQDAKMRLFGQFSLPVPHNPLPLPGVTALRWVRANGECMLRMHVALHLRGRERGMCSLVYNQSCWTTVISRALARGCVTTLNPQTRIILYLY